MRANLTRDVAITIDTPVLQPNGTSAITATVSNAADTFEQLASLTINGEPVSLSQNGTLAPGATRAIPLTLTQTQLGTAQTIAVTLTNGADDAPNNNSVVLPAQIPALGLQLQSLIPQYDGTFLANWRTTNLSNIDVTTTTVRVAFSATTVVTGTIPPIPAGTSLDRTLLVPAQIQGASPAAQLFIDETNGISATQRLTLAVAPRIALELDTNTLAMDDTGTLTVTVFNNGMVTAPAHLAQIRVYARQNDGNDAIITSTNVLELLPLNASQYTLTVPSASTRCGIYVRLDGLGVNMSKNAATVPQSAVPCADFVAVANPENRLNYTFSNQSTLANPTSYLWTFGDGSTSTAAQPTHTFAAPGTYAVRLQVSNATTTTQFSRTLTIPVNNPRIDGITDGQFSASPSTAWWSTPSTLISDWYGEDVMGSAYARMESDVVASTTVSQTITLTQHNPYLVFDMFTNSSESVCGNDKLQIYFGTQLLGQRNVCTDNDRLGWNTYAIRIPKTKGTTGKIRFVGVFNGSIRSTIGIDNVTLMTQNNGVLDFATQPAPAPTPTNTRMPTMTRTPTTTRTPTPTRSPTRSSTKTSTATPTRRRTTVMTRTVTRTAIPSNTRTRTKSPTRTRTPTPRR
jgi:PKD repeat protein